MNPQREHAGISRRDFLKAAGLGALSLGTLSSSGIFGSCAKSSGVAWDEEADVVVAGSGAAASAAAVTARNEGASVIMLEKASITGGTTAKSGGEYWIPNNFILREKGIPDPKEDIMRFFARGAFPQYYNPADALLGISRHDYDLLSAFYDNGSKAVDYFAKIGALQSTPQNPALTDYLDHTPDNKVPRGRGLFPKTAAGATGFGAELIAQTRAWLDGHDVRVLTGYRVTHLVLNDRGEVMGVEADAGGTPKLIRARKAVIFGTGGFTHNLALRTHFQPEPLYGGCAVPTNEGDFVFIAQAAGAQLSAMNSAWNAEIPLEPALDSPSTPNDIWQPAGDSMMLVNKYGKRVVNEKRAYNDRTKVHFYWDPTQQEYPNQVLCMIYDQRSRDLYSGGGGGYPMPAPGTTAPYELSGQTWDELAQKIKSRVDQLGPRIGIWRLADGFSDTLRASVTRFNVYANNGVDEDFGRGSFPYDVEWHKTTFSVPVQGTPWPANDKPNITMYPFNAQGPYYCILIAAGTLDTNGGPMTNDKSQVLDTEGVPIPGLYGAGNCIASPTRYYFAGGGTIGPAITWGYLSGINAAKEPVKTGTPVT
jgi:3-oxosteroid 1-dehydrogenase